MGGDKGEGEAKALRNVCEKKVLKREVTIGTDLPISVPYWLAAAGPSRPDGAPRGPAPLKVVAELEAEKRTIRLEVPVEYAWIDPVRGERLRECVVAPPATVTPAREAAMAVNGRAAPVELRIRAGKGQLKANVVLPVPRGWRVEPAAIPVEIANAGDEETVRYEVRPPEGAGPAELRAALEIEGRSWSYREDVIDWQTVGGSSGSTTLCTVRVDPSRSTSNRQGPSGVG